MFSPQSGLNQLTSKDTFVLRKEGFLSSKEKPPNILSSYHFMTFDAMLLFEDTGETLNYFFSIQFNDKSFFTRAGVWTKFFYKILEFAQTCSVLFSFWNYNRQFFSIGSRWLPWMDTWNQKRWIGWWFCNPISPVDRF